MYSAIRDVYTEQNKVKLKDKSSELRNPTDFCFSSSILNVFISKSTNIYEKSICLLCEEILKS